MTIGAASATGEAPAMSADERLRLFDEVKQEIGERGAASVGTPFGEAHG